MYFRWCDIRYNVTVLLQGDFGSFDWMDWLDGEMVHREKVTEAAGERRLTSRTFLLSCQSIIWAQTQRYFPNQVVYVPKPIFKPISTTGTFPETSPGTFPWEPGTLLKFRNHSNLLPVSFDWMLSSDPGTIESMRGGIYSTYCNQSCGNDVGFINDVCLLRGIEMRFFWSISFNHL